MRTDPKPNTRGLPTLPALVSPLNGTVEIAGPDQFPLDELIHKGLRARNDPRDVATTNPDASFFGIVPSERNLIPGDGARIAETRFADWLSCSTEQQPAPSVKGA